MILSGIFDECPFKSSLVSCLYLYRCELEITWSLIFEFFSAVGRAIFSICEGILGLYICRGCFMSPIFVSSSFSLYTWVTFGIK